MENNQKVSENIKAEQSAQIVKEGINFSRLEYVFAYILLAVGFCFMRFVVYNVTGIFTTVFFFGMSFASYFYLKKNNYKFYLNHKIQFGLLLIFSVVFSITANNFIKFLNIVFLLMTGIYWTYSVCKGNKTIERLFFFDMLKAIFIMPFASFGKAYKALTYPTGKSRFGNNLKSVLLGLLFTIPLTIVVAKLLQSADSGLEELLNSLFNNFFESSFLSVIQFIMGIPVAFYIFGMLYSNTKKLKKDILNEEQCENKLKNARIFPNLAMYSAVMPIIILYVMFFISQLRYFISAFNGILPEAYSYAEYARRGFFELFLISIINLGVLLILNFLSKQTGENKPVLLKTYSILLSVFTILIIATALSKMILYISNYGLTQLRVYTSWFMVLLIIIFVLIIIQQLKFHFCFARYAVVSFVILFGVLCFSNVDGSISKFNIKMYQQGYLNDLDVAALCNLSDDSLVYVLQKGIDTQDYLDGKLDFYDNNPYYTYNLSSRKVKALLESMPEAAVTD